MKNMLPQTESQNHRPKKKRKRRKAAEIERKFKCQVPSCRKAYGTEGALKFHMKQKHADYKYVPSYLHAYQKPSKPVQQRKPEPQPQHIPQNVRFNPQQMPNLKPMQHIANQFPQRIRHVPQRYTQPDYSLILPPLPDARRESHVMVPHSNDSEPDLMNVHRLPSLRGEPDDRDILTRMPPHTLHSTHRPDLLLPPLTKFGGLNSHFN
eukprot:TRINITY_DN2595_c0_g1_i2.p1 TRINITY_DN2595_c0_g1~~TRINITY_DN2595_c0_g1_i2.p1  ORF type:complete len:208 (-),score=11.87 TRINITY_DN2595_c0_g1_i2:78-701(-)